jgi:hypothetical protein
MFNVFFDAVCQNHMLRKKNAFVIEINISELFVGHHELLLMLQET